MKPQNKQIWGWALYDWANSAFATTVIAGFFPIFFKQYWSSGVDANWSTAQLGIANSLASLLIALVAPFLGVLADQHSAKKRFLFFFTYLGILTTAALAMIPQGAWEFAIIIYILGVTGFSGANIFYDSLLPHVATEAQRDQVSSLGYGLGYLGGGILFLLNVLMTLYPQTFYLKDATEAVQLSFLSVALWWGSFSLFIFFWVPEPTSSQKSSQNDSQSLLHSLISGFKQLKRTFKQIKKTKHLWLFLLAYWCYIDGVDTIIRMAVDYGLSLGFASNDLIVALLMVQFVGFPSALLFGKIAAYWGTRNSIFCAIAAYAGITLWGVQMQTRFDFYGLAIAVGLVQGGIQALSRSYYSLLIPKGQEAEFFGFYNMLGKFAAILGPALMGITGLLARYFLMPQRPTALEIEQMGQEASRWSMGSVILLFLIGGLLFYQADAQKKQQSV